LAWARSDPARIRRAGNDAAAVAAPSWFSTLAAMAYSESEHEPDGYAEPKNDGQSTLACVDSVAIAPTMPM
jgi:hypothetical protein